VGTAHRLFHEVKHADSAGDVRDFLQAIKEGAHLFQGITDSTMTHAEGWQFIQAGRHLERASQLRCWWACTSENFQARTEFEPLEWIGLLQSCTAFEAYCKAYTAELRPDRVAEFLVLNAVFPHSIRFSADALAAALKQIGTEVSTRRSSRVERIAGRMQATLAFGQIDEIMSGGLKFLSRYRAKAMRTGHTTLYQTYIAYPVEARWEPDVLFDPAFDAVPLRFSGEARA